MKKAADEVAMSSRERVLAAVRAEHVDRVPFGVWHHFHLKPAAGPSSEMGAAELAFYRRYKPDFLKVMHDIAYEPMPAIERPEDWARIPVLDPHSGNFGAHLATLREIRQGLGSAVLMIETVFSVYHYAEEISGKRLLSDLGKDPDAVRAGLASIAQSLESYAGACIDAGCDGIYYAVSGVSGDSYYEHFLPYDLQILSRVREAPFNVLHLHAYHDPAFDLAQRLPASVVSWSDRSGGPSLARVRELHRGCLMGGIDEAGFRDLTPAQVREQGRDAIAQTEGRGFILAPGCAIPENSAPENIESIAEAAGARGIS